MKNLAFRISLLLFTSLLLHQLHAQTGVEYRDHFWKPNGGVNTTYYYENLDGQGRLYIGGKFDYVGPSIPHGAEISASGTANNPTAPAPDGPVHAALEDGSGGWYIGGEFTKIGTTNRRGLAHIFSTGALDPAFNPDCAGVVYTMVFANSLNLVVAGSFDSIGGQPRKNIAMVSKTGVISTWNPGAVGINGTVLTMIRNADSLVYVGGDFTSAAGQSRNRLAALSVWSNAITSWNPDANGTVRKLNSSGNLIYAAGSFTSIGASTRNRIAIFDRTSSFGVLTSFNPVVNGTIYDLLIGSSGNIYLGGSFSTVGGISRNKLAELTASGSVTSWNPNISNSGIPSGVSSDVRALGSSISGILVGGTFRWIGGALRANIAEIDRATGLATSWDASAERTVGLISGTSKLYVGGWFSHLNGVVRSNAACINTLTGRATEWNPAPDNVVHSIDMGWPGPKLYMGGEFSLVNNNPFGTGAVTRNALASFDVDAFGDASSSPNAFNANLINSSGGVFVTAIETPDGEGTVFIGGAFSSASGQSRSNLASYNISTSAITSLNIGVNGPVYALKSRPLVGDVLYVGGTFTNINSSTPRSNLAALSTTTNSWFSWAPQVSGGSVYAIDVSPTHVVIGGNFTSVGGLTRNRLAMINYAGTVEPWNPSANGTVESVRIGTGGTTIGSTASSVYVGGQFSSVGGVSRNSIAALSNNPLTAICYPWNPEANVPAIAYPLTSVKTICLDRYNIYTGGTFHYMADNWTRKNFMALRDMNATPRIEGPSMSSSGSIVCANASNTFNLMNDHNLYASSFNWSVSPSTGVTISGTARTSRNIKFTNAGNYIITVTPSGSNNDLPMTLSVTVLPLPTGGTISGPASVCSGGTASFTLSGMSNATSFTWSAPVGASLLSSSPTSATYQFGTASSYTISVTGSNNGCIATAARTRVVPTALPPAGGTLSGPSSVCQTSSGSFSITGMSNTSSTTTYTWTATNGATLSGTGASRNITFPNSGNSTITVQTANGGCTGTTLNRAILVNSAPTSTYAISGSASACEGTAASFSTTATSGVTYSWSISPSTAGTITPSGNTATVSFNGSYSTAATTVTVSMVPSIGSCSRTSSTRTVTVNKYPTSTTLSAPIEACSLSVFTCTAAATFANTFTWSVSKARNSGSGTGPTRSVTMGTSTVTVTVTPKNGACSGPKMTKTVLRKTFPCSIFREGDPNETEWDSESLTLSAYPNPAADQLNLKLSGLETIEYFTIRWYDLSGKLVRTSEPVMLGQGSDVILHRDELPTGVYSLQLQGETTQLNTRVIFE